MLKNDEILKHDYAENNIYWRLYREVLPGYYEGTIQIYYTEPYSDWRHKLFPIRVNVLGQRQHYFLLGSKITRQ